jgi:hypothetical protein
MIQRQASTAPILGILWPQVYALIEGWSRALTLRNEPEDLSINNQIVSFMDELNGQLVIHQGFVQFPPHMDPETDSFKK